MSTALTLRKKVFLFLLFSAVLFGAIQYQKLISLYRVVTLFDADKIVHNFSHMNSIMFSQKIPRSDSPQPWPVSLRPPARYYEWQGERLSIEEYLQQTVTTSLLVLHDGVIVHEDYRLGTAQTDLRISWSVAKSFLSAMFGMAVAEGAIDSLQDPVDRYVSTLSETAYADVPIVNVLNMASGVEFDEDYLAFGSDINKMGRVLALGGSMDKFAHSITKRARGPGEQRQYVSIDTHVLAMVLRHSTGFSLQEYFEKNLWAQLHSSGEAYYLTDGEGAAFALGGLNMQTRDYARFGELFRLRGRWNDAQIVPAQWVLESTHASAPVSTAANDPFGYGYQWWVPPEANGEFFAGGIYGQFIYVNPQAKTVIVKTSAHRGFRDDGEGGRAVKWETIQMFRAIAAHYAAEAAVVPASH